MRQKFFIALLFNFFSILLLLPALVSSARPQCLDLWADIAQHFSLDNRSIQQTAINKQIHWYVKNPKALNRLIENARPYLYYVYQQIRQRNLPAELALIPLIESSYNPFEKSPVGASGLWQMMPTTAAQYGLSVSRRFDGRLDILASTQAALDHFSNLHSIFGDWLLAIVAYDAGAGKVHSTIVQNQLLHASTQIESLPLPMETKFYLTKLLALATIIKNPQQYHVDLPHIDNAPFFTVYDSPRGISSHQIAELSNTDFALIQRLNPQIDQPASLANHSALLIPTTKIKELNGGKNY